MGGTKHRDDPDQRGVDSRVHVHEGCGQQYRFDTDPLKMDLAHCVKLATALVCQVTVIDRAPLRSSILSSLTVGLCTIAGNFIRMNAGVHAAAAAVPEGLAMLGTLGIVSTMGCVHTILGDVKNQFKMDSP